VSTIDGRPERTTVRRQTAADLLRLVGLDPARYDLGQLHDHDHKPTRFCDDEIVDMGCPQRTRRIWSGAWSAGTGCPTHCAAPTPSRGQVRPQPP
jgi:hypothetical protein